MAFRELRNRSIDMIVAGLTLAGGAIAQAQCPENYQGGSACGQNQACPYQSQTSSSPGTRIVPIERLDFSLNLPAFGNYIAYIENPKKQNCREIGRFGLYEKGTSASNRLQSTQWKMDKDGNFDKIDPGYIPSMTYSFESGITHKSSWTMVKGGVYEIVVSGNGSKMIFGRFNLEEGDVIKFQKLERILPPRDLQRLPKVDGSQGYEGKQPGLNGIRPDPAYPSTDSDSKSPNQDKPKQEKQNQKNNDELRFPTPPSPGIPEKANPPKDETRKERVA